jgi:hypothetical protein
VAANDRQNAIVDESTDSLLHHPLLLRKLATDIVKVERIELTRLGHCGDS